MWLIVLSHYDNKIVITIYNHTYSNLCTILDIGIDIIIIDVYYRKSIMSHYGL